MKQKGKKLEASDDKDKRIPNGWYPAPNEINDTYRRYKHIIDKLMDLD